MSKVDLMTDTEKATLERRIDELCNENERLRKLADGAANEADRLTHDAATLQIENAKLCAEVERRKGEYAKLVDVLHEVEQEAIYAYHCLQQDCVTTANSSEHFFEKWWHAECELDRAKDENAKLRELASILCFCMQIHKQCDDCKINGAKGELVHDPLCACDGLHKILRELGIEVSE